MYLGCLPTETQLSYCTVRKTNSYINTVQVLGGAWSCRGVTISTGQKLNTADISLHFFMFSNRFPLSNLDFYSLVSFYC